MNNNAPVLITGLEGLRVDDDTTAAAGRRETPSPPYDISAAPAAAADDALPVSSPAPAASRGQWREDNDDVGAEAVDSFVGGGGGTATGGGGGGGGGNGGGRRGDDADDDVEEMMRALKSLVDEVAVLPEGELMVTRLRAAKYRLRAARDAAAATTKTTTTAEDDASAAADDEDGGEDGDVEPEAEEDALPRELARSRALARSSRDILDFWTGLSTDPSGATRLLHRVLCVALRGHPGLLDSARELAARYTAVYADRDVYLAVPASTQAATGLGEGIKRRYPRPLTHEEMHGASETMVGWQSAANFGTGFTAGLGGLITLPVTLPATLGGGCTS